MGNDRRSRRGGVESGADIAILQSTPMAVGVYTRHGFRRLFRYRLFRRP
jgi:hypothetical protein